MHRWHSPIAWWFSQIVQWHSWRCHSSSRSLQTHKLVCEKTAACLQVVCNSALNNLTRYIDRFFARFLDKVLIRRTKTTVVQLVDFHVRWSFEFLVSLKRKLWNCIREIFQLIVVSFPKPFLKSVALAQPLNGRVLLARTRRQLFPHLPKCSKPPRLSATTKLRIK
jgi:hypothetical protein